MPNWINTGALKRQHFQTMLIPTDCSWIFREVLKLRPIAIQHLKYNIDNGRLFHGGTKECLTFNNNDISIAQSGSSSNAFLHRIICIGEWVHLVPIRSHCHVHQRLLSWLAPFNYPRFDLQKQGSISWNGTALYKLKTWHIWDSTRFKLPDIPCMVWFGIVCMSIGMLFTSGFSVIV